jgi:hypothetical protein
MSTRPRFLSRTVLLTAGPPYCNDVVIDKVTGLAFLACDPFKPSFYPPYEMSNVSRVYGSGGIWLYDTNVLQIAFSSFMIGPIITSNKITISRGSSASSSVPSNFVDDIPGRTETVPRKRSSRKSHAITGHIIS